jgi:site-specific DNA recombinase
MKPTLTKKPRCVLYCRVSSDEQRNNTSLESQEEYLRKFSSDRNMVVDRVFYEDFSAKTFDRPEWKVMVNYLKKNRKYIDYLFVYDYTRFGRNTSESFHWHSYLQKINIEVQSITQWVDYNIPEHVYQLGIYFAGPQVDNKWRSIKTTNGMRARMKQGIYVHGKLPLGYLKDKNTGDIEHDTRAPLIRQAFELVYRGQSITLMAKKMRALGIDRSVKTWGKTLRNTYYKGWITNRLLDEPVKASNMKPIVPSKLFDAVQEIIDGKRPAVIRHNDEYPLKGFCSCASCSGALSGYKSTKKKLASGNYLEKRTAIHYYICNNPQCRTNYNMKKLHAGFEDLLLQYQVDEDLHPLIQARLQVIFQKLHGDTMAENVNVKKTLTKVSKRLENLNLRFIDGDLDSEEYQLMKEKLLSEKRELEKMLKPEFSLSNPSNKVKKALDFVSKIASKWKESSLERKQQLQRLVFPEGISYDKQNKHYLTPVVNRYIGLISALGAFKSRKATLKNDDQNGLFSFGSPQFPFIEPLQLLSDINLINEFLTNKASITHENIT